MSYRAENEELVRQFQRDIVNSYPDASHHCLAWRMGRPICQEFATDAGEPRGTAGRPILGEIRRRNLINTLVFVIRYFGGKKLGVRGLIDAYGSSAAQVLERSGSIVYRPKAVFTARIFPQHLNRFIHQLLRLTGDKKGLTIRDDLWEVQFSVPLTQAPDARAFLNSAVRAQTIERYRQKEGP